MHGGSAPQVRAAAQRRLAEQQALRVARRLGIPVEVDPLDAMLGSLHSAWGSVLFWQSTVADLELRQGDSRGIIGVNHQGDQALHIAVQALAQAEERAARIAKACHDAGIHDRQVRLAEQEGELIARVVRASLADLGVDARQLEVAQIVARHLRDPSVRELEPAIDAEVVE